MLLKKRNINIALVVYWVVLFYFIAALAWWFIELTLQNNIIFETKVNELQISSANYNASYLALLQEKKRNLIQFVGEGSIFLWSYLFNWCV